MKPHPLLFPFSLLYGLVVSLRNLFFDIGILKSADVGVPVISIGSITAGGSGKTPVVMNVISMLMRHGKKVAMVSRGYGRITNGTVVVSDGTELKTDAAHGGDEPVFVATRLQSVVIVDEDRVRGAKKAIEEFGAEIIVLDDGFQHRRLQRTKDIVLIDAQQPPFGQMLLPAGYRRESIGSLRRADAVLITKCRTETEAQTSVNALPPSSPEKIFSSAYVPSGWKNVFGSVPQSLDAVKNRTVVAFCGIAVPDSFKMALETCAVTVKRLFEFPDHHQYTQQEIEVILNAYRELHSDFIVTTEKDAVRLWDFEPTLKQLPLLSLSMDVHIHQHNDWEKFLLS